MARKHPKHGPYPDSQRDEEAPAEAVTCWLCGRPTGKTIVWHQTVIANFTNSELQRHGMDVEALLADPSVRKFVDWVAKKDPDFTASTAKKQR